MNYLSLLTEDEVHHICATIQYKDVISYFKHNPKEFNKICRGFRATSISEEKASQLLTDNVNSDHFVSSFVEKRIDIWLSQIKEHFESRIKDGDNQIAALLNTLPFSVFSDNISIYLKLTNQSYSDDILETLCEAVSIIKKNYSDIEKLEEESKEKDLYIIQLQSELNEQSSVLEHNKGKIKRCNDEIVSLKKQTNELEKVLNKVAYDQEIATTLKDEIASLTNIIRKLRSELSETKSSRQLLESQIKEQIYRQQTAKARSIAVIANPKCPCDLDEFKDYLGYNLKNIGITSDAEYFSILLNFLSKVLFQGTPILINKAIGLNLMTCVSNALIGQKKIKTISYADNVSSDDIRNFLSSCERIACLDNFIGNCNETELLLLLEDYQNKIIFLTIAYDRTLFYVPQEFLKYCNYINLNRIGVFSIKANLTEDPSVLAEVDCDPRGAFPGNRYSLVMREILHEVGIDKGLSEQKCSAILDEQDLIQELAFDVLPYCADVQKISPFITSERLLKYAGDMGRCPSKDLFRRWFAL